jgi:uncharacterized damage-inducible protein DinB
MPDTDTAALSKAELLRHWRSHRGLTRRTIEVFPDDELFSFRPAPPLRSFGAMMLEVVGMLRPTLAGLEGEGFAAVLTHQDIDDKAALLAAWDETTEALEASWARIPAARLAEEESAYGFPERPLVHLALYLIDNEIHHRAQGYIYLRELGIEPPSFYQR